MKKSFNLQELSDAELLSLVCANQQYPSKQDALLERTWRWHQKDWRTLAKSSEWDLLEIYGIEPQMARRIMGVFEISRRYQSAPVRKRCSIKTSKDNDTIRYIVLVIRLVRSDILVVQHAVVEPTMPLHCRCGNKSSC